MQNTQWTTFLNLLKQSTSHDAFATWAGQLQFHSFDGTTLIVEVPSRTFVDVMWDEIGSKFQKAYRTAFGEQVRLQFFEKPQAPDNSTSGQVSVPSNNYAGGGNPPYVKTKAEKPVVEQPATPKVAPINSYLVPQFTFETFVEGRSNKTALSMAASIAKNPHQTTFNPFFLYGPSGVGKTHLVNAVGHHIKQYFPNLRVLFVSANLFKTQYTDSVLNNTVNDFIHFYQTIDVLIIDDFQEVTTPATQKAFFHIFNHLHQNNHKILITCDRAPSEFEGIEERMLTRLKWGVVTELERPDLSLRRAILESKMKRIGLDLPSDVVLYIADNVSDNVRELEGTINSLMAFSLYDSCDITLDLARRVVTRLVNQTKKEMTLDVILTAVCEKYKAKSRDLIGKSRKKELVALRQLVMYLARKYTKLSISQIGREMGGRDHSTVLHSCTQIEHRLSTDKTYRLDIEKFEANLKK